MTDPTPDEIYAFCKHIQSTKPPGNSHTMIGDIWDQFGYVPEKEIEELKRQGRVITGQTINSWYVKAI